MREIGLGTRAAVVIACAFAFACSDDTSPTTPPGADASDGSGDAARADAAPDMGSDAGADAAVDASYPPDASISDVGDSGVSDGGEPGDAGADMGAEGTPPSLRVVLGDAASVQFCVDDAPFGDPMDHTLIGFGSMVIGHDPAPIGASTYKAVAHPFATCSSFATETTLDLEEGRAYTAYLHPRGLGRIELIEDDPATPGPGLARVRVFNTIEDLDVCVLFGGALVPNARTDTITDYATTDARRGILSFHEADTVNPCAGDAVGILPVDYDEDTSYTLFIQESSVRNLPGVAALCTDAASNQLGDSRCVERELDLPIDLEAEPRCNQDGWCREYEPMPDVLAVASAGADRWFVSTNPEPRVLHDDGAARATYPFPAGLIDSNARIWTGGDTAVVSGTASLAPGSTQIFIFDGVDWSLDYPPLLGRVTSIWGTSLTNLFVAGHAGQIYRYDGSNWSDWSLPSTPPIATTTEVLELEGGASSGLVAHLEDGALWSHDGAAWSPLPSPPSTPNSSTRHIEVLAADDLWVVTHAQSSQIFHYDGSAWTERTVTLPNLPRLGDVSNFHVGPSGDAWVLTSGGYVYRRAGGSWESGGSTFRLNGVRAIRERSPGVLDLYGARGGVYADGVITPDPGYVVPIGLACDANRHGILTEEGHLIAGTNGDWSLHYTHTGLSGRSGSMARQIELTSDGRFVFLTRDRVLVERSPGGSFDVNTIEPTGFVTTGGLWLDPSDDSYTFIYGYVNTGVNELRIASNTSLTNNDPRPSLASPSGNAPLDIWGAASDDIWLVSPTSRQPELKRFDGATFQDVTLPIRSPQSLHGSGASDVWVSGGNKVAVYDGSAWTEQPVTTWGALWVEGPGPTGRVFVSSSDQLHIYDRTAWTSQKATQGDVIVAARPCGDTARALTTSGVVYSKFLPR